MQAVGGKSAALELVPGIKRRAFRGEDPRSKAADAEYQAKRPGALRRQNHVCGACGYRSEGNQIHHLDDDHGNNSDGNLGCACILCHPYQHVGEASRATEALGEGLGKSMVLSMIPELSAVDLNHLQRVLGVALDDPAERPHAERIHAALTARADSTVESFGTAKTADFAAAMSQMEDDDYQARGDALLPLRLVFSPYYLRQVAKKFSAEHPALAVNSWGAVMAGLAKRMKL